MGGPEVFQYFFVVLFLGLATAFFSALVRDEEGKLVSFKVGRFFGIILVSIMAAIIAGFVGCEVGRP